MSDIDSSFSDDLSAFIDASPSPFHAVETAAGLLREAGFSQLDEGIGWSSLEGGYFVIRDGSLIAFRVDAERDPGAGYALVGAHTDSPGLRIKPLPDVSNAGVRQLGVEVYGGPLLNSWLDRDLGISGRLVVERDGEHDVVLVRIDDPILRISQLAIHLDGDIRERGLLLNRQRHLSPMWGDGVASPGDFRTYVAGTAGVDAASIRGWDLMVHDTQPSQRIGASREWLAAPRIDNQASCHAAVRALTGNVAGGSRMPVVCLFDHEEVGSMSATGAAGSILPTVLARIGAASGVSDQPAALANSACISADGAHATHPNYADRHEPEHPILLNGGPVIKRNSNVRYATDARGQAIAEQACRDAGVPMQHFVTRSDLGCGSTIGPVTAAGLGVVTVDMGMPQLSMHSAREVCGAADPAYFAAALDAFFSR